ncbi:MAG: SsrA-binding protein SmpB [Chlamydiae bacterium]|nr:SsrA-binding protein SmpB [Chlamydiota bacterium]
MSEKELVGNRKAFHDYEILQTLEAGLMLLGTEIKSLRANGGSLQDSFVIVEKDELWLINSSIAPYSFGGAYNHEERRKRKLLVHKVEFFKLKKQLQEKGLSLIPLSIYLKNGIAKIKIAVAKGKKSYDKRAKLKEKEEKRTIDRSIKERY